MDQEIEPGEKLLIDGKEAEVIEQFDIGDTPYIRAVFDGDVKEVCMDDVTIVVYGADDLEDLGRLPQEKNSFFAMSSNTLQ